MKIKSKILLIILRVVLFALAAIGLYDVIEKVKIITTLYSR
jgi:hypothetical protein